jgi:hypothetical protein
MATALWLGGCAAHPPALIDIAAQIRSDFGAGKQSCAAQSPNSSGQNHLAQAKCFTANPVAQSKASAQTAEMRTKQRIVNDQPHGFNTPGTLSPPKLASANGTVVEAIPTFNSEASCHLADNLAVDQNLNHCLALESGARDHLARKWAEFPSADRSHCIRYSTAGGGGTYTSLLSCLESEADARNLHAKSRSVAINNTSVPSDQDSRAAERPSSDR